ncbi:hypothetical protein [Ferruginibacter sp.]|nr:hypothetical protein [Ferruginibacter sp.]
MKRILLPVALLLFYVEANAQQAFTNNGNLQIHTGASVNGFGSFTNSSGASLTNNGSLYIQGDVTNNQSAMAVGTGTLYLNGSSTQTIGGTQTFKTYNLVTNNNAGITLNNNLSASGVHTFTAGNISTSATPNYMVYEAGASYTGDNDAKHVIGWVKKLGNTDFTFPVGNGTYERTIALTNLTASSEFDAKYFDGPTPNVIVLFSPLVLIDGNEYWRINKISGANARVMMNWDNSKVAVPQVLTSNIRAAYYNNSFWASIGGSGTGSVATTGSVISNSVAAFNNTFTIGSTAYVLPLSIVSFTGNRSGNYNALRWTINNETDVLHYELQRSNDAVNFTTINTQNAKNNGATALYNYDDVAVMQSKIYYRLKCIDNNGQIKYSGIVIIEQAQTGSKDFYVVKNPVQDKIDIYAAANLKGTYNYTLANSTGQVVQSGVLSVPYEGIHTIQLQTYLPKGIYVLLLRNEQNVLQKNILKE